VSTTILMAICSLREKVKKCEPQKGSSKVLMGEYPASNGG
jgi:hypothetical protein